MTKYLFFLIALLVIACSDNFPTDYNSLPDIYTEQPDVDTTPVWVTDQIYAGLEWSTLADRMTWYQAVRYCKEIGARLPNITELRKIIINCPVSTYGGVCEVDDPYCLLDFCYDYHECACDYGNSYSALGDNHEITLWSSSYCKPTSINYYGDSAWVVAFKYAEVVDQLEIQDFHVRCVR